MHYFKALGLDGMLVLFFLKFKYFVGKYIIDTNLHFLNYGVLPNTLNQAYVTLIPKTKALVTMKGFQTISLSNVVYKIIFKILADHMKLVLLGLIYKC